MQALRVQKDARKEVVETTPIPEHGPDDVLIKVKSAGLAPGLFNMVRMGLLSDLPATLGHQTAGVVEKIGENVSTVKVGSRVRVHSSLGCQNCEYCLSDKDQMCHEAGLMGFARFSKRPAPLFEKYRNGGLAEYICAPGWVVDELPDHVSFDLGAKVHELATALCTVKRAELELGSTLLITAPTGAMGSAILKIAHLLEIGHLILVGRSQDRLEAVAKLTSIPTTLVATETLPAGWVQDKGLGKALGTALPAGADAIIDLTPSGTELWQAFSVLKTNGTFVHLGANFSVIPLPAGVLMQNCWKISGTRNHSRGDALTVLGWLRDKKLDAEDLITHKWSFDDIHEAIAQTRERSMPMWMSVVNF